MAQQIDPDSLTIHKKGEKDDLRKVYKCGCVVKLRDGIRWEITDRCPAHRFNIAKKIEQANRRKRKANQSKYTKNRHDKK